MQQNSFGFRITLNTGIDLTDSTVLKITIKKPVSKIILTRTLSVEADVINAAAGEVSYLVQTGDLDEIGAYFIQFMDATDGNQIMSSVGKLVVYSSVFPAPS